MDFSSTCFSKVVESIGRIRVISRKGHSGPASYPLYDDHGNMISTLSKQGTGGYTYTALRTFDAWGMIRRGAQTGDPKGRYCASLGHKQDDESGLVYMRARYYEPRSGRFASEDQYRNGANFFCYCGNDPLNYVDQSGNSTGRAGAFQFMSYAAFALGFVTFISLAVLVGSKVLTIQEAAGYAAFGVVMYALAGVTLGKVDFLKVLDVLVNSALGKCLTSIAGGAQAGDGTEAKLAVTLITAESLLLVGELFYDVVSNGPPGSN